MTVIRRPQWSRAGPCKCASARAKPRAVRPITQGKTRSTSCWAWRQPLSRWDLRCGYGGRTVTNQGNGRPLGAVVSEIKQEIIDFTRTRYQMLVSEMQQKLNAWKMAIPFLGAALFLAFMGMILLSLALVAVIAVAIGWGWA